MSTKPLQSMALAAYDETESLLATLRACETVAELVEAAGKRSSGANKEAIGELLHLHADALERRIAFISTTRQAIAQRIPQHLPGDSRASAADYNAAVHIDDFTQALRALESVALLVPLLDGIHGDGLGETVRVVVGAMQEQADAMLRAFDELRNQLYGLEIEPAHVQQEGAQ